jgi:3-deoxy-D-manno-octulosonic-acid transferase
MSRALWAYNAVLPALRGAARIAAVGDPKLRRGLAGRRGVLDRLRAFGAAHAGRCLWIHSTSVGEYEQARPIAGLFRERHPEIAILHTFFSPSGYEYAARLGEAEHFEYLPEDAPATMERALDAVRPRALVFMKFDLWPNAVVAARSRGIPVLLLAATLRPRSLRSRWPARALYREVYRNVDLISAVSDADALRFRGVVPDHSAIFVDGDPRFDQVLRRRRASRGAGLAPVLVAEPRPWTLVAGSTWGPDERVVLPAWRTLSLRDPDARLVIAPHEPTPANLASLEQGLARLKLESLRYSELEARGLEKARVVVVDRVGILAELYEIGDAAYVGGAFTTGVHNVLEPAVAGRPVVFGPRHDNAPEANRLLDERSAMMVGSEPELRAAIAELHDDAELCRAAGARARALVEANLGASARCCLRLERCLDQPSEAR